MINFSGSQAADRSKSVGGQLAFEDLVRQHQSGLRYSLRQLTNWDEALADDLAQETFLQAYKKLDTFRGDAKFSSWLYRIGYNIFLQHQRKKQLDYADQASQELDQAESNLTESSENKDDFHRDLAAAMAQLSPEARSVMHLMLHRQCTQQEISDIMGVPLGTVKTHINRSKPVLQSALAGWRE